MRKIHSKVNLCALARSLCDRSETDMRGSDKVYHRPYHPTFLTKENDKPYICRLAPSSEGFEAEWLDNSGAAGHTLYYKKRGADEAVSLSIKDSVVKVTGLDEECEYEIYIENSNGAKSNVRLIRTSRIPEGTAVINYLHPEDDQYAFSGHYLCSPSIVRAGCGRIIASMDIYGKRMAQNLTVLFYSDDDGESWRYLCDLYPFYWSVLFMQGGKLYILGQSTEYGDLRISSSSDNGETWSAASILFYGSNVLSDLGGINRAPMPLTRYGGRLWANCECGCWVCGHIPGVMSIDENDDPMIPSNWSFGDFLPFEGEWQAASSGKQGDTMEGSMVVAPDGKLYNYLRWKIGSYLRLKINTDDPEAAPVFDGIYEAPVSNSMFKILPYDGKYIMVTNTKSEVSAAKYKSWSYRNVLSVYESEDLRSFKRILDVVNREDEDATKIGFQYPSVFIEGDMLYLMIRSAFNCADSFHDSNYMLFAKKKLK